MVGYFLAAVMFYSAVGVIGGMPLFIHKLKLHDLTMVIIGCASTLVASVLLAFANKPWMVFAGMEIMLIINERNYLRSWDNKELLC